MKKQLKIVGLVFLLLAFALNGFLNSEIKISYGTALHDTSNRPLIEEKSIVLRQPSIGRDCKYMYGYNAYPGPEEMFYFALDDPGEYNYLQCSITPGSIFGGSTYGCDDIWYITGENGILYGIDIFTCEYWCIGGGGVDILDLAYDPINYKMYGCGDDCNFYIIDQCTGEQKQIGLLGCCVRFMAFDAEGVLYGWGGQGQCGLCIIDTETGATTDVCGLGISINYITGGDFCRETDTLYLTAYISTGQLYKCDKETGACTFIGTIGSGIEVWYAMIPNNCTLNSYPEKPTISGPDNGVINNEYNFTIVTTDSDGDDIYYLIDWGDNYTSGWIGPYSSGEVVSINHTWSEKGLYEIKAIAKDIYGLIGKWSDIFLIDILGEAELEIGSIKGGLFKVSAQINNIGGLEAVDVNWKISLEGGALIGKKTTGIVNIPAGENFTINSKFIFGFGPTKLTITAEIPESSDSKSRGGFALFFYVHVNIGS